MHIATEVVPVRELLRIQKGLEGGREGERKDMSVLVQLAGGMTESNKSMSPQQQGGRE